LGCARPKKRTVPDEHVRWSALPAGSWIKLILLTDLLTTDVDYPGCIRIWSPVSTLRKQVYPTIVADAGQP